MNGRSWNLFINSLLVYFIAYVTISIYSTPPKSFDLPSVISYFVGPPFLTDLIAVIFLCFYLKNIEYRFQTLNNFWICLQNKIVSNNFKYLEMFFLMENVRLLHIELSTLVTIFNFSFGPVLLSFYVANYVNIILQFFFILCFSYMPTEFISTENILRRLLVFIINVQCVIFMMFPIIIVSSIKKEVTLIVLIHF